jgi:hypothetical protein
MGRQEMARGVKGINKLLYGLSNLNDGLKKRNFLE